jgi:hypothetical protein
MRWKFGAGICALLGGVVGLSACKELDPPPPAPFRVNIAVEGDPGKAIMGATIFRANKLLATTSDSGKAELSLNGGEGEVINADVKCPVGFTAPTKPLAMRLTRLAPGSPPPEFRIACPPNLRHMVVAIKAENGPNLPVTYLDKVIAVTDVSGAAHFAVDLPPGTQFQVGLDTHDKDKLKPQMPSKPFTVGSSDDILVFEQKFQVEKKKVVVYVAPHPKCLTCGGA